MMYNVVCITRLNTRYTNKIAFEFSFFILNYSPLCVIYSYDDIITNAYIAAGISVGSSFKKGVPYIKCALHPAS